MQLPSMVRFGGTKFGRGWDQLMYGSLTLLRGAPDLIIVPNESDSELYVLRVVQVVRHKVNCAQSYG